MKKTERKQARRSELQSQLNEPGLQKVKANENESEPKLQFQIGVL